MVQAYNPSPGEAEEGLLPQVQSQPVLYNAKGSRPAWATEGDLISLRPSLTKSRIRCRILNATTGTDRHAIQESGALVRSKTLSLVSIMSTFMGTHVFLW